VVDVNLARDKQTGSSRGFAFLAYERQPSTVLAVDNFQGIQIGGRSLRVDHVLKYRSPEDIEQEKNRRTKERIKYADLVTDELFKSATGDMLMIPAGFENYEIRADTGRGEENTDSSPASAVGNTVNRKKEKRDRKERRREKRQEKLDKRSKKSEKHDSEGTSMLWINWFTFIHDDDFVSKKV